ncbi:putative bifunctional diguanylate cyclase/phosphodiesterase [Hoeflea sp.]|uniref:putative bifunctional diguanylate cyclase/phosphodiesterase n=1 Tax=Hoeflea sp. TaxID=1940281 RepID=UPI003B520D55
MRKLKSRRTKTATELVFGLAVLLLTAALVTGHQYLGLPMPGSDSEPHSDLLVVAALAFMTVALFLAAWVLSLRMQVNKLNAAHEGLQAQTEIDSLTGVLNREKFIATAKSVLDSQQKNRFAALFIVDVDHFKQVNDTHGHPAGDSVLSFFARMLSASFPDGHIGRLGGDEFAVLVEHSDPMTSEFAHRRCSEFVDLLAHGVSIGTQRLGVSASVGIALAPFHGKTWTSLVANADMALYASKRNGRACSTIYTESMLTDLRNEKALVREIRAALLLKQFRVAYQPIVDPSGEVTAYEALLRWNHALRGPISPEVFIPAAERAGLITDIGHYVLRQVCQDLEHLLPVSVNVNLSAEQITSSDLIEGILDILNETGTDPHRIVLEITESASLVCNADNAERLLALQAYGFRIAFDDFGMGYSEFNQLRMLPFDIIKIDKSFIRSLGDDVVTDVFVSAVVEISRRSGKSVVAEGIETETDRQRALAAGCDRFQGYYYSKPRFLEDFDDGALRSKPGIGVHLLTEVA